MKNRISFSAHLLFDFGELVNGINQAPTISEALKLLKSKEFDVEYPETIVGDPVIKIKSLK